MKKNKKKQKTWHTLKDSKCPKCGVELSKGLFDDKFTGCQNCGFTIRDDVKNLLVKRDDDE